MFKYSIWKLAIVSRSFRLQENAGLNDTYALSWKWEKVVAQVTFLSFTDVVATCVVKLKAMNDGETNTQTP